MFQRRGAKPQRRKVSSLRLRGFASLRLKPEGFTSLDLIIVVATVILAVLVLPLLVRPKVRCGCGPRCMSNQKQIALAFRMWANDQGERFPMELTMAEGGAKESALQGLPLPSFASLSNELNNPRLLACPQDPERARAMDFAQLAVTNLSYFLGLNASETNPASILAGDRNVCVPNQPVNGLVQITNSGTVTWTSRIHKHHGNVAFADGSVSQATDAMLQKALRGTGFATNAFAVP